MCVCRRRPVERRKVLREDDDTPMTMFFGFMGAIIFTTVAPLLLLLWCGVGPGRAAGLSRQAPDL